MAADFDRTATCDVMTVLVRVKADVDKPMDNGWTPTYVAAQNGFGAMVELLAHANADVNKASPATGFTPALAAARHGHCAAIAALGSAKADLDRAAASGVTPAQLAAFTRQRAAVEALALARADLNKAGCGGATPVQVAAQDTDDGTMAAVLLSAKASLDQPPVQAGDHDRGVVALAHNHGGGLAEAMAALAAAKTEMDEADEVDPDPATAPGCPVQ